MLTTLAESYIHTIDPFAVHFSGNFGIRWYGLAYIAGIIIAWAVIRWLAKTNRSPVAVEAVGDLMLLAIIGVLVGGRLGYVIFYEPELFIDFTRQVPFWGVLAINKGGMASHGGIIGVVLACWFFARRHRVPSLHILDMAAFTAPPGLFLGRIANFVNAELWGRALPDAMWNNPPWWSVKYPQQVTNHWLAIVSPRTEPTPELVRRVGSHLNITAPDLPALREAVTAECAQRLDIIQSKLQPVLGGGETFYQRLLNAAQDTSANAHNQVMETLRPLLTPYYPSQIYQALTDGPILLLLLAIVWWKARKPGVVGAWFLIGYAVLRIATEFYRQPDLGVEPLSLGVVELSRGQVLSALMLLAGVACLVIASQQNVASLGGLKRVAAVTPVEESESADDADARR